MKLFFKRKEINGKEHSLALRKWNRAVGYHLVSAINFYLLRNFLSELSYRRFVLEGHPA